MSARAILRPLGAVRRTGLLPWIGWMMIAGSLSTASAASATQTPEDVVGTEFRISFDLADESVADVAYDTVNNRFLVVWEIDPPGSGIAGAIYNADGSVFRAPFIIFTAGTFSARPKAAFGSGFGYVVVWEDTDAVGGRDILARSVSTAGVLGNFFDVTQNNPALQANPDVAAVGPTDFFIVWQDERNGTSEIYGQSIVNTVPFGNNVRLTNNLVPDVAPAIAPGLNGHSFVVWEKDVGANMEIYGGLISREGVGRTPEILLGFGPAQQVAPAIAFAPDHSRYFAAWESDIGVMAYNIEGAFIDINFTNFAFFVTPGVVFASIVPELEPDVAYDDANDQFLVVWEHSRPFSVPTDWDVLGRFIGADGVLGPQEDVAVVDTTSQLLPAVAFGSTRDEFFVVWQDNRNIQLDIWGQRVKYVPPSLTVTAPNGGESWAAGTSQTITWNSNIGSATTVTIELERGGSFDSTIAASTENDGSFDWTVPSGQTPAGDYRVRITSVITGLTDTSDADFSITSGGANNLTITSPNGGETWQVGTLHTITWSGNSCPTVRLELYKGGSLDSVIVSSTANDGSFDWTIPSGQTAGSDYRVRVVCTTDANNRDESDADFSISTLPVATITVTAPNGGESWVRGTGHTIRWSSSGPVGSTVNIALYKGGSLNSTIASGAPNNGQFNWTIPPGQAAGTDYRVRVTDASNASVFDESNGDFSITSGGGGPTPPTVISPNGGEVWMRGGVGQILWSPGDAGTNVRIDLIKGAAVQMNISPATPNSGVLNWPVSPSLPTGSDYLVRIASTSNPALFDISDGPFTIQGVSHLRLLSPNGGEVWHATEMHTITWVPDGGQTVQIELRKGGSLDSTIASSTANDGSFDWTIPAGQTPGSDYRVRVFSTTDPSADDSSDGDFTIGPPPMPDLQIEGFDFSPQDFNGGDAIQFSGRIINKGSGTANESFWVEFRVSHEFDFSEPTFFLCDSALIAGPLGPGESFDLSTLSRTVYTPAQGLAEGAYIAGIKVDVTGAVAESNESNNTTWITHKKLFIGPRPSRAKRWLLYR